jgi:outer membrane protein OmpA-like peptidoglycan-associated protein
MSMLAKLEIGASNDRFEQEAERVADQVMRMPDSAALLAASARAGSAHGLVQRMCEECAEEERALQRDPLPGTPAPPRTSAPGGIPALRGRGQPLSAAERAFFEPRFGHDFGAVRIHADARAADMADAVHARAFTVGSHIVFASGRFAAGTQAGRRLLAHELTHVVQQQGGERMPVLQRQQIQPTCNGTAYDPTRQCCCDYRVIPGPCPTGTDGCAHPTTRDNEYDGCSVPPKSWEPGWKWESDPAHKDNPGRARDTWFSDPSIHGTQIQDFEPKLPCDVHDKCYQTCGSDRRVCDEQLFRDARAVCDNSLGGRSRFRTKSYERCIKAVETAKAYLSLGSWISFNQRQREYCGCCPPPVARGAAEILFGTGRSELDSTAQTTLTECVERHRALLESGAFDLTLIGHASRIGSEQTNQTLSEQRIAAVRAGIEERLGAPLTHVDVFALGEQLAEQEGRTERDDSAGDRKVEITIVGTAPPSRGRLDRRR